MRKPAPTKTAPAADADVRPTEIVTNPIEIGRLISQMRRGLMIRQADLAARAKVSRQWIVALEQGKPKLDVGMVMRTLMTMGFEISLKPYDPIPPWILRAVQDMKKHRAALELRRNLRRRTRRRELARDTRRSANAERIIVDLE